MANLRENYADLVLKLRDGLGLHTLIETGTAEGLSTVWAAENFEHVFTIDVRDCQDARARCAGRRNVEFIVEDSRTALSRVLSLVAEPCFIWLDAHHETGKYGVDYDDCTVLDELRAINDSHFGHAILIDDVHYFAPPWNPDIWPRLEVIMPLARAGGYETKVSGEGLLVLDPDAMRLIEK